MGTGKTSKKFIFWDPKVGLCRVTFLNYSKKLRREVRGFVLHKHFFLYQKCNEMAVL